MPTCRACSGEVPAGLRWCTICHSSLLESVAGKLASPGKRLGAYFLDILVPFIALFIMLGAVGAGASTKSDAGGGAGVLIGIVLFLGYAVWALMLFASGTTPGKKMLGMRVIKENGQNAGFGAMLIREWIGKLISGMIFSLGFLWILFDRDRQGWHDKLVSTYVVE